MKLLRSTMILMLVLGFALSFAACSGNYTPVNPDTASLDLPETFGISGDGGRNMIAAYTVEIDPVAETVTMEPTDRVGAGHLPLSIYFPVLAITWFSFGPPFQADIRLAHPYPGSGIDGFDARVVAVLPANAGVSMEYPTFGVLANDSVIQDPLTGYTPLYDNPGIPGSANPFIAYFKTTPFRVWSSTGTTSETQRWTMDLAGFGGPLIFVLICDVSTNFPSPPQPIVDNCPEPAEILDTTVGEGMTPAGGSAPLDVVLLDWQTPSGVIAMVECPSLFAGTKPLTYSGPGPGSDEYVFSGTISNDKLAPEGFYNYCVGAMDSTTQDVIFEEFGNAEVKEGGGPGNWTLDTARGNVNMSLFTQIPIAGTDLTVIDSVIPDWAGVLFYDDHGQVVRAGLDLLDGEWYGYGYLPHDDNPADPHPNPADAMPGDRIDGANNGFVLRSWNDGIKGFQDNYGGWQRNDNVCLIEAPIGGELEWLAGQYVALQNDNLDTPDWDERDTRFRVTDVCDEADTGNQRNVMSVYRAGTEIMDETQTWYVMGSMGGMYEPYYSGGDPPFFNDWPPEGVWIVWNPPMNEIVGWDASQDLIWPMFYWAFSGVAAGPGYVQWYDKDVTYIDLYFPSDDTAYILDLELIPIQDPPLVVEGKTQYNDWVAILMDNKTIEIFDPFITEGELVEVVDLSALVGDVHYLDVGDTNADIFISHSDGVDAYCSVFEY